MNSADDKTHSAGKHFSGRLVIQTKENDNLADSAGDSTVHCEVIVFESLDDIC